MEKYFKIGEITRLYSIGVDLLPYYEEIGIIPQLFFIFEYGASRPPERIHPYINTVNIPGACINYRTMHSLIKYNQQKTPPTEQPVRGVNGYQYRFISVDYGAAHGLFP